MNIKFDCSKFVDENSDLINSKLKSFELGVKGTIKQTKYDKKIQKCIFHIGQNK